MNPNPFPKMTPEEFLAFERASPEKHEYYDGVIVAMSGARRAHNLISLNIGSGLLGHLNDKDCETYMSEMRVFVHKTRLYAYPDVVVTCGDPQFQDDTFDTLMNPLSVDRDTLRNHRKLRPRAQISKLPKYWEPLGICAGLTG
jgi:Uma2 family endonuclease